ncbi:hypothetical protein GGR53DRAFT_468485 [Hypoxylon sp. FL1150]|nr:hypothetical protein GGR53DRAFT_468485 [Hypoxylon sp. FL1150]
MSREAGITAFERPYCAILLYQQCVVTFNNKRAEAEKPRCTRPTPTFEPGSEPGLATRAQMDLPEMAVDARLLLGSRLRSPRRSLLRSTLPRPLRPPPARWWLF